MLNVHIDPTIHSGMMNVRRRCGMSLVRGLVVSSKHGCLIVNERVRFGGKIMRHRRGWYLILVHVGTRRQVCLNRRGISHMVN